MNWDAFGAVAEMIGALAVILTLAYLAVQIRQNTAQGKAGSHQAISDALNQINIVFATNPEVSKIWLDGLNDRASLTDVERWQFDSIVRAYFHVCETMFYQSELGSGDKGIVLAEERGMKEVLAKSGGRESWVENPYGFSVEFRCYVDRLSI
jgi:hypothetical protein